jgi:hypothetical protein
VAQSNIDSKQASKAQDRFKKSAIIIRLLRADRIPQTFSTASVKNGHAGRSTGTSAAAACSGHS